MQTPTPKIQSQATPAQRQSCLGCSDCKGLCAQLLDLVFVPESVLHRSIAVP